jgi:hypothetical protein
MWMPESIEQPYLNMPARPMEKVRQSRRLSESNDQESPFARLQKKESEEEQKKQEDTFEKEAQEETEGETLEKGAALKPISSDPVSDDGPGQVIDVTV